MSTAKSVTVAGVEYRNSGNKTDGGKVIFNQVTGKRGRPPQFIRKSGKMVPRKG